MGFMEIQTIHSFLDYFAKIRERTMRLVACIPPDKIEWRAAEGKFTLATDFGDIEPELNRVESVRLPHRAATSPAQEAEAVVQTTEGVFTLRSCALADDRLTGQSDLFGSVSLQRDALRSIQFRRSAP